jgi:glutathione S-transferase
MSVKLYYYPNNASLAPHFILKEIGCEYELILIDRGTNEQKSESYMKLNPLGRIPTITIDNITFYESPAICMYLSEKFPECNLCPMLYDIKRPLFLQWMMYLTNTLQAELMIYYHPDRHVNDELNYDCMNIIKNRSDNNLIQMLNYINTQLHEKQYLLGDTLSTCDFFLLMLLLWLEDLTQPPMSFSNINSYIRNLLLRESVQYVCKFENINLDKYI